MKKRYFLFLLLFCSCHYSDERGYLEVDKVDAEIERQLDDTSEYAKEN